MKKWVSEQASYSVSKHDVHNIEREREGEKVREGERMAFQREEKGRWHRLMASNSLMLSLKSLPWPSLPSSSPLPVSVC